MNNDILVYNRCASGPCSQVFGASALEACKQVYTFDLDNNHITNGLYKRIDHHAIFEVPDCNNTNLRYMGTEAIARTEAYKKESTIWIIGTSYLFSTITCII